MDENDDLTDTSSCNYDEEDSQSSRGFSVPNFNVTTWNPDLPVGLHYISLVPLSLTPEAGLKHANYTDERRLRTACNENDLITVTELLEGGADASCEDDKKRTPLHFAASQGHVSIVQALLDKGADPNKKDFIGNTPLHLAACTCQVPVVTLLLKADRSVVKCSLMMAYATNLQLLQIRKNLFENSMDPGTDVKSVDGYGRSPLALAKSRLKFLAEEKTFSNIKMKNEVIQISDMMKTYLSLSGCHDDADQLEELCSKLQISSTREEVDLVNNMLADFASLTIQKKAT